MTLNLIFKFKIKNQKMPMEKDYLIITTQINYF